MEVEDHLAGGSISATKAARMTVGADAPVALSALSQGVTMKTTQLFCKGALAAALILGLGACSGMSSRDKNTAIGAGVGAVGGAILTEGSVGGTVGGAAVGGIIGNQVGK